MGVFHEDSGERCVRTSGGTHRGGTSGSCTAASRARAGVSTRERGRGRRSAASAASSPRGLATATMRRRRARAASRSRRRARPALRETQAGSAERAFAQARAGQAGTAERRQLRPARRSGLPATSAPAIAGAPGGRRLCSAYNRDRRDRGLANTGRRRGEDGPCGVFRGPLRSLIHGFLSPASGPNETAHNRACRHSSSMQDSTDLVVAGGPRSDRRAAR